MNKPVILAVDDDPINLEIIRETLSDADLELHFASSGMQAMALLTDEGRRFDTVILDRMMPGMDGLAVLEQIKASPRLAGTPVVMQTAAAGPEQVEEGLRSGAYYYLTKPYSPAALRTIVHAALETGSWRRQLSGHPESLAPLRFATSANFVVRTLRETSELAGLLAALCPDPGPVRVGLAELLVNALEHGNLAISYAEKSRLKREERWEDEIEQRQALAQFRERRVHVTFQREPNEVRFTIRDEGQGFVWQPYLEFDPVRAYDPNGRGIALAKALSFSNLRYEGSGNVVIATVALTSKSA
jgi:CheY-like chemotaxis protein